jgi:hypothetical protein
MDCRRAGRIYWSLDQGQLRGSRQTNEWFPGLAEEWSPGLELNHGNPYNLIRLSGGVNFTDEAQKDQPWQTLNTNYAMAGSRAGKSEFTLDGASNTIHDQARGSVAAAWAPPSDTVAEFKVQTAVFDATTGQTEGGVVNISLKSGTNKLHGSAYWGKQTPSMNGELSATLHRGNNPGNR